MRRFSLCVLLGVFVSSEAFSNGFFSQRRLPSTRVRSSLMANDVDISTPTSSSAEEEDVAPAEQVTPFGSIDNHQLTQSLISKLRYRQLMKELEARSLDTIGTTNQLRERLREAAGIEEPECVVNEDGIEDDCEPLNDIVDFIDMSDPVKELVTEIESKAKMGHWKAATRKLKKLTRRYPDVTIPDTLYLQVLEACMDNRMQGARASEPARKILEQLMEHDYEIPVEAGNYCIKNSLGSGPGSTHQGFGGIDTALAMMSALEHAGTKIQPHTYDKMVLALAREGSVEHALQLLRTMVVDLSETPPLSTFAEVAQAAVANPTLHNEDKVLNVLAYVKAAGYELDTIASTQDGRTILACGVIMAERVDNVALGLRLLTAAGNAKGVAPDRGDTMVALSSSAAQRACQLIHKRAIIKAVEDGQWKLAVKALELMLQRALKPSSWIWRNVVTCCAKQERSRKATALLLDWIAVWKQGKADKPPLSVFNTVVNACEICDEQELTLKVLDAMKETHDTEGNLITFNIALKRLAKNGDFRACEGIIIGMLQAGIEPSVVSYTTAIASCVQEDNKQATLAYEWLKRMRSRNVKPNVLTYNTALAACLDGSLESTMLASKIASEMMTDVELQLQEDDSELDEYTDVVPDSSTKFLARRLMEQLKSNWQSGAIEKRVATDTVRVPLRQLVDFSKTEVAERARQKVASKQKDDDQAMATRRDEVELEYQAAKKRTAEV